MKQIIIFFGKPGAGKTTLIQSALERNRYFDLKALERRLLRDFPNSHLNLLKENGLDFKILNTENNVVQNIKIIKNRQ
ncbi:MAG: ATP-binding protein [Planctomycetes bacterium]|jgi:AAA15 family ATPase/GTPase|nr:ATP-binding protein [Planctomycetota bacterium]